MGIPSPGVGLQITSDSPFSAGGEFQIRTEITPPSGRALNGAVVAACDTGRIGENVQFHSSDGVFASDNEDSDRAEVPGYIGGLRRWQAVPRFRYRACFRVRRST